MRIRCRKSCCNPQPPTEPDYSLPIGSGVRIPSRRLWRARPSFQRLWSRGGAASAWRRTVAAGGGYAANAATTCGPRPSAVRSAAHSQCRGRVPARECSAATRRRAVGGEAAILKPYQMWWEMRRALAGHGAGDVWAAAQEHDDGLVFDPFALYPERTCGGCGAITLAASSRYSCCP